MKAITIRQPWAWLIINAGKDVENRTWYTHTRGPVLIHAARAMTQQDYVGCWCFLKRAGLKVALPHMLNLRRQGVIGSVEIVDCVAWSDSPWFTGPWGFVLKNPKPLPFRGVTGALGFFDVPDIPPERVARLRRVLGLPEEMNPELKGILDNPELPGGLSFVPRSATGFTAPDVSDV